MEKRIRRLTVEIERRRLTWSSPAGGWVQETRAASTGREDPGEPCPTCGSPWVLLREAALSGSEPGLPALRQMLASLNLHIQATPSGELWICQASFERLKENL